MLLWPLGVKYIGGGMKGGRRRSRKTNDEGVAQIQAKRIKGWTGMPAGRTEADGQTWDIFWEQRGQDLLMN